MSYTDHDKLFMTRAFELSKMGLGSVSPNPMVGCVIVESGEIIGEGWHKKYGEAHAEVNAVNSVIDRSRLKDSTVYVTLEPCSHFGKTPPCADLLIRESVKKVVIANQDPNPLVAGNGLQKLKAAGIEVVADVLPEVGRNINRRFFTFFEKTRPYIILKWAETADGFVARKNFDSKWISDNYSRMLVHKWRTEEDGILVGSNTVRYDNPQLTVRDWNGRNPVRIVIDRNLTLSGDHLLFNGDVRTLVYNNRISEELGSVIKVKLESEKFLSALMKDLFQRKIQSIIVEGGAQTLNAFISDGLWDEARVFHSPDKFNEGIAAPKLGASVSHSAQLNKDRLTYYFNN